MSKGKEDDAPAAREAFVFLPLCVSVVDLFSFITWSDRPAAFLTKPSGFLQSKLRNTAPRCAKGGDWANGSKVTRRPTWSGVTHVCPPHSSRASQVRATRRADALAKHAQAFFTGQPI